MVLDYLIDKNCPFVITLHDVIPYKMPDTVGEQYLKIFNEKLPNIIPLCDGIITVLNIQKKILLKLLTFQEKKYMLLI